MLKLSIKNNTIKHNIGEIILALMLYSSISMTFSLTIKDFSANQDSHLFEDWGWWDNWFHWLAFEMIGCWWRFNLFFIFYFYFLGCVNFVFVFVSSEFLWHMDGHKSLGTTSIVNLIFIVDKFITHCMQDLWERESLNVCEIYLWFFVTYCLPHPFQLF